jgi:transposase-like protein
MRPEDKHVEVVGGVRAMALKRRKFTQELKLQVVREMEADKPVAQTVREYDIHPTEMRYQHYSVDVAILLFQ